MGITYFAAPLRCPHCGHTSPDDTSTCMVSHLLDGPQTSVMRAGDRLALGRVEIIAAFYLLRTPLARWPLTLLQDWLCPSCHATQFALVVFEDGGIARIDAVPNPREALAAAHLATERLPEIYELFTREPLYIDQKRRPDFLQRFKAALPASGTRWSVL